MELVKNILGNKSCLPNIVRFGSPPISSDELCDEQRQALLVVGTATEFEPCQCHPFSSSFTSARNVASGPRGLDHTPSNPADGVGMVPVLLDLLARSGLISLDPGT